MASRARECCTLFCSCIRVRLYTLARLLKADNFYDQRLLVLSSSEPSSWAPGHDIRLGFFLSRVRHWLCIHPNMATTICLSLVTWHWYGNKSINNPGLCGRKFTCFYQRGFSHGMAALGRVRDLLVGFIWVLGCAFAYSLLVEDPRQISQCTKSEKLRGAYN